jgi:hypothetical protein
MAITTNGAAGSALTVSADLAATISDESGTGVVVFNTLPTFGTTGVRLSGSTSGTTTVVSGATAGTSVLTLPVATDTLVGKTTTDTLTNKTLTSPIITGAIFNDGSVVFEGATADAFETTLAITDPTADRTITFQDATGTVVLRDSTDTLTNKTLTSPVLTTPSVSNINAKGDVLIGTADNTLGILSVGTDGYVLTADSTVSPSGLKWAVAASGGGDPSNYIFLHMGA